MTNHHIQPPPPSSREDHVYEPEVVGHEGLRHCTANTLLLCYFERNTTICFSPWADRHSRLCRVSPSTSVCHVLHTYIRGPEALTLAHTLCISNPKFAAAGQTPMQQLQLQQAQIQREQARINDFWTDIGKEMAQIDPEKVGTYVGR